MSNTIPKELHEEIVTELQYKVEELEREIDDLNEETEDNKQEHKESVENLETRIIETLSNKKVREYSDTDRYYNYAIEVCICYVEDMFEELLSKLGG